MHKWSTSRHKPIIQIYLKKALFMNKMINMTTAVQQWLIYKSANANLLLQLISKQSQYKKTFKCLCRAEQHQCCHVIPQSSLLRIHQSPWHKLYASKNDQAFITLMGFDMDGFKSILHVFALIFDKYASSDTDGSIIPLTTRWPKRQVQLVALVLFWTRTRGSMINLQLIFAMMMTNLSMYLHSGQHIMIHVLISNPCASLGIPSEDKITEFKAALNKNIQSSKMSGPQ